VAIKKSPEPFYAVATTTDPIELHILHHLDHLRQQNLRLRTYVQKAGIWADLKDTKTWKPFHFLHYFCNLYEQKYKRGYRIEGNMVKAYQRIELFMKKNKIPNEEYREFIELAFARYFTPTNVPILASICSASLYNHLMTRRVRPIKSDDWYDLDMLMKQESEEFEQFVNEDEEDFDYLDNIMAEEAKMFENDED
jgi:hypothetical protein